MIKNNKNSETPEKEVVNAENEASKECSAENKETATESESDNMTDESFEEGDTESRLADELNVMKDKYIRLSAEFDNYRKRTLKEKMDLVANGGSDVVKSVLTILDDFDRAEVAMASVSDVEVIKQGTKLIFTKFADILRQKGLKEVVAMGEEFNTDFFEAVVKIPVEDKSQSGKVVDVIEKGYTLNDKVLRFAKVVVGE